MINIHAHGHVLMCHMVCYLCYGNINFHTINNKLIEGPYISILCYGQLWRVDPHYIYKPFFKMISYFYHYILNTQCWINCIAKCTKCVWEYKVEVNITVAQVTYHVTHKNVAMCMYINHFDDLAFNFIKAFLSLFWEVIHSALCIQNIMIKNN
jgi:hypothetical protein